MKRLHIFYLSLFIASFYLISCERSIISDRINNDFENNFIIEESKEYNLAQTDDIADFINKIKVNHYLKFTSIENIKAGYEMINNIETMGIRANLIEDGNITSLYIPLMVNKETDNKIIFEMAGCVMTCENILCNTCTQTILIPCVQQSCQCTSGEPTGSCSPRTVFNDQ